MSLSIALIVGTNRPGAASRKVAQYCRTAFQEFLNTGESIDWVDLGDLPINLFQPATYGGNTPKEFEPFKEKLLRADGIFLVIPEYNGGAPGVLKYFIDLLPFPESLQNRTAGFVGISDGRFGNVRGVEQIEAVFKYRKAFVYPERIFIANVGKVVDENGKPKDELTLKLLRAEIEGFLKFTRHLKK